jgi:hypothetical protein
MGSASWISGDRIATSRAIPGGVVAASPPGGLLDDLSHGLGGSSCSLWGFWRQLLHRHPRRDVATFSTCQQHDMGVSAYDYSSWSSTASRRELTFDYTRLRQRRFGSRGLGHGLGLRSGLLDGRRDFSRLR